MPDHMSVLVRRWFTVMLVTIFILTNIFTPNRSAVYAATVWTVTTTNDDADGGTCSTLCSLRDALSGAANGDMIQFQSNISGTIMLGSAGPLVISTNVTITGPGVLKLAIDGATMWSVFIINNGDTASISGLTIQHGNGNYGGGIYNQGTLLVNNTTFSGNTSPVTAYGGGAGIYSNGMLTVTNSTLSGNSAYEGGGIRNEGMLVISNSSISDNSVTNVGGGILNDGTITMDNSAVSGNSAVLNGGGIRNDGTLTMTNTTVSGNLVAGPGGGIVNIGGTLTINSSSVSTNTSTGIGGWSSNGGGISNNSGTVTISNSTLSGNTANQGGAIYASSGALAVSNSTISSNSATAFGGGIESDGGTITIGNSTLSGNGAVEGGGIYNGAGTLNLLSNIIAKNIATYNGPDIHYNSGTITSLGYNLIGNGTASYITTATGDQIGTNEAPIDPVFGTLGDHGGATQTMPIQSSSPAYQKGFCGGNISVTPNAPTVTTDQRGHVRKSVSTGGCDVGAYEVPLPPRIDSIGIYRGGTFYLRLHNSQGFADSTVGFSPAGNNFPVVGDWTGAGFDSIGVMDQHTAKFTLCTANVTATCTIAANQIVFILGNANDTPLVGRWQIGATHAGAGVYRPSNGVLYLKNALSTGFADDAMVMGLPGDSGVAGDWTGKGFDSPGIFRPGNIGFFLSNQVTNGPVYADIQFTYGSASDLPIAGDWIAQGHDGIGMFRPTNGFVYLKNALNTGFADNSFFYGAAGDQPVAGHWQLVYPPIAPVVAPVLIPRTPIAQPGSGSISVPGDHQIGG